MSSHSRQLPAVDRPESFRVTAELETAWARRLRWHWGHINYTYLDNKLRRPQFQVGDSSRKLGEWNRTTRTITVSRQHILKHTWECVLDTLRHEMAHQYVQEHLGLVDAPPHGEAFRDACRILRCDASATTREGTLTRLGNSKDHRDRALQRIRELLALANSPNEHEAESAMRMAQKFLLRYNLDLDQLDRERGYETRYLGQSAARVQEWEYVLSTILQDHFFVLVIWTWSYDPEFDRPGKILQITGTPENLEIAEYVWEYVRGLTGPLWDQRRKNRDGRRPAGTKLQYLAGLLHGLYDKLCEQQRTLREEHGLVWVGDSRLTDYYRWVNPRVRTVSGSGVSRSNQYDAGLRDGREIRIRKGLGGAAKQRGHLLDGPMS